MAVLLYHYFFLYYFIMKKSDYLFDLVKSLTGPEKRYFARYAKLLTQKKENKYLLLFRLLFRKNKYDEPIIKKKIKARHYAQLKHRLYLKILEGTRLFYADKNTLQRTAAYMSDAWNLLNRGLYEGAYRSIVQSESQIQKYGHHELNPELIRLQNEYNRNSPGKVEKQFVVEKRKILAKAIEITNSELSLESDFAGIIQWNREVELVRSDAELSLLKEIISGQRFSKESDLMTPRAKIKFNYIRGLYNYLTGNFAASLKYFSRESELILQYFPSDSSYSSIYFKSVANTCFAAIKTKNPQFADIKIRELDNLKNPNRHYSTLVALLLSLKNTCENKNRESIRIFLDRHDTEILEHIRDLEGIYYAEKIHLLFKAIESFLLTENKKTAVGLINIFLNHKNIQIKKDFYCMGRMINLLIQFSLKNTDLLEYEIISVKRFLKKQKRMFAFEKSCLELLGNLLKANGEKERLLCLREWETQLDSLKNKPFEKNVFDFFDFSKWVKANLLNFT